VAITVAALFMMPILARGKRNVGRALNSRTLLADAAETTLCALLSATGILGLGFNARFGWHWADPVAGLVILAVLGLHGRCHQRRGRNQSGQQTQEQPSQ
jgi:divalent metal cation (Fe/Co/Zn/Cd) transporter